MGTTDTINKQPLIIVHYNVKAVQSGGGRRLVGRDPKPRVQLIGRGDCRAWNTQAMCHSRTGDSSEDKAATMLSDSRSREISRTSLPSWPGPPTAASSDTPCMRNSCLTLVEPRSLFGTRQKHRRRNILHQ